MAVIYNKSDAVKVLKAYGMKPVRLSPGYNDVSDKNLDKYFESDVAKSVLEESLSMAKFEDLNSEQRAQAKASKEKNELLNKAHKMNVQNKKKIEKKDAIIEKQTEQIDALMKRLDKIESKGKK